MKQVLIKKGKIIVPEVPAPQVGDRNLLVKVLHSCISVGTEIAGVKMSALPLYKRALKQPHHVKKVLQMMRDQGIKNTLNRVLGTLASGTPTGYSACGEVIEVGGMVQAFKIGDYVGCAGAGVANHAEYIDVPSNLAVPLPKTINLQAASTVTLGAIAMQGIRRCSPTLGETIVVFGLGILGQITVQLLLANGCNVIGVDLDAIRLEMAMLSGMTHGINPQSEKTIDRVLSLTENVGADAAIITAATESHSVVSDAMGVCRKKGRVILVGDVGLNLNRHDFYKKELDFFISCSYGPGRYDPVYEENGQDYPLPYVRWTENRNMEAYIDLLIKKRINFEHFTSKEYSIDQADEAFKSLQAPGPKPLLVFLNYPLTPQKALQRTVEINNKRPKAGKVGVAIIGAGGFAQGMHLPNLQKLGSNFQLIAIQSRTGFNARSVAIQYGAQYATTELQQVLDDPNVDLVIICTRHHLHVPMAIAALDAGKHVLLEKPLAISPAALDEIKRFFKERNSTPILMTGFNRRFAPISRSLRFSLSTRTAPLMIQYTMNAGFLPADHWVHGEEGGGRNVGEACHIYDLFNYLVNSSPVKVTANSIGSTKKYKPNENFFASITYADGSVCNLLYTALGNKEASKERMEVFADGKVYIMENFKTLTTFGGGAKPHSSRTPEKGQLQELELLGDCITNGGGWPISLEEQLQATETSFLVEEQLSLG